MRKLLCVILLLTMTPIFSLKAKPSNGAEIRNTLPYIFNQRTQTLLLDMPIPDPSLLIGSLVNIREAKVFMLGSDNCLTKDAKPTLHLINEKPIYNHIISDSLVANVGFLSFIKAHANESNKVELCVNRINSVDIEQRYLDEVKIQKNPRMKNVNPDDWGIIIGYSDYLISANIYSSKGSGGDLNAFSVNIGGNVYKKEIISEAMHRVEAIWAPIPFINQLIAAKPNGGSKGPANKMFFRQEELNEFVRNKSSVTEILNKAIEDGKIPQKNIISVKVFK
ncbi:MAG: hypothetical protein HGA52_03830 [Bacteroidales bacterium]|nr:hypothetical protein [Bacteroidales bacterium]